MSFRNNTEVTASESLRRWLQDATLSSQSIDSLISNGYNEIGLFIVCTENDIEGIAIDYNIPRLDKIKLKVAINRYKNNNKQRLIAENNQISSSTQLIKNEIDFNVTNNIHNKNTEKSKCIDYIRNNNDGKSIDTLHQNMQNAHKSIKTEKNDADNNKCHDIPIKSDYTSHSNRNKIKRERTYDNNNNNEIKRRKIDYDRVQKVKINPLCETTDNKMDIDNDNNNEDIDIKYKPPKKKKYKSKRNKKQKLNIKKKNTSHLALAKLESTGGLIRSDFIEGDCCSVCCDDDIDDISLYCDGCNVLVHMGCYGIIKKPKKEEQWFCDPCKTNLNLKLDNIISCCICNTSIDGAYKIVKKTNIYTNHWAHTSCVLWITGVNFINKETLSPISIDNIDKDRYKLKCIFCKKKGGACLQCEYKMCTHAFHVPCAQRGTAMLELREDDDRVYFHSFCPLHTDEESRNSVPDNNSIYPRKNSSKKRKLDDENNSNKSSSIRKKQKQFQSTDVRKRKLSDLQPVIVCSKLSADQINGWENFKEKFNGIARFRTTWHHDVTHVITSATVKRDKRMLSARTIKYLKGVIAGSWILCFDWIDECLNKNTLVSESNYEVLGDKDGKGACKMSRELRQNTNDNGLFSDIICVIGSEFQYVELCDDLKSMFRMGGANTLQTFPYEWLTDINKYKKEKIKGKTMVFVYDIEQYEMNGRELEFCDKFSVLPIGYKKVFDAISNYKRLNEFVCND